jgi:hypothetical protein
MMPQPTTLLGETNKKLQDTREEDKEKERNKQENGKDSDGKQK